MIFSFEIMKVDEAGLDHTMCGQAFAVLSPSLLNLKITINTTVVLNLTGVGAGSLYTGTVDTKPVTITRLSGNRIDVRIDNLEVWQNMSIDIVASSTGYNQYSNSFEVYGYDVDSKIVLVNATSEKSYSHIIGWHNPLSGYKHYYNGSSTKGDVFWYELGAMVNKGFNHVTKYPAIITMKVISYRQSDNLSYTCEDTLNVTTYNFVPDFSAQLENNLVTFTPSNKVIFTVPNNNISLFPINGVNTKPTLSLKLKITVFDLYHNQVVQSIIEETVGGVGGVVRYFNLIDLVDTTRYIIEYGIELVGVFASKKELSLDARPLGFLRNLNGNRFVLTNINNVSSHFIIKEYKNNAWVVNYDGTLAIGELMTFEITNGFHLLSVDNVLYGFVAYGDVITNVQRVVDAYICNSSCNSCESSCSCFTSTSCHCEGLNSFNCGFVMNLEMFNVSLRNFFARGVNIETFSAALEIDFKVWNKSINNLLNHL